MKKIFSVLLILVLALSFSLVPAVPAAATEINVGSDDSIQAAIDAASPGDTITVAAGTYREYLHITTDDLTIEGAGIDESIIDLDGLIPYWHYPGNRSFASRAGVLITGYGSPDNIIEGVTFRGFTVKNAGLNPPITATGTHTGADDAATLTDSTALWTDGELVGQWVHNVSDKLIEIDISGNKPIRSYGLIEANTATTVTATLAGGLDNDWDAGDTYVVMPYEEYVDVAEDLQDDVRGISIGNGKDVSILYCKVINSGYGGITAGKARIVGLHSEGVTIDHCISSDHPQVGISVGDHLGPVTITNNTCSNNKRPHPTDPSREYAGVGIQVSGSSSLPISGLIAGNTCINNGFEGILLKNYSDGVVVENNKVAGSNFDADGAGIFFYGKSSDPANCKNNIIRNNTVTGNIRGIVAYYAQGGTIEGNTITTDSGAFDYGQAAIKIDGGNNITVKDNIISSCDGVGIRVTNTWNAVESYANTFTGNTITGAKFAGVRITKGARDNTLRYNTVTGTTVLTIAFQLPGEETQGDGVFIDDDAGTGNVFHENTIYDNEGDGMENQTTTPVDAEVTWWGSANGPYNETSNPDGLGNAVSDNVKYSPWCASADADPEAPGYQPPTPMVWGVCTNGTIQEAIDDFASPGDTVIVAAGTYEEAVVVNKSLALKGEQKEITEIKFGYNYYPSPSPLTISAAGVKVSGFTIRSGPYIELGGAWTIAVGEDSTLLTDLNVIKEPCLHQFGGHLTNKGSAIGYVSPNIVGFTFTESTVDSAWNGIYTREGSSDILVKKVDFTYPGEYAILLKTITGATIEENTFTSTADKLGVIVTRGSDEIEIEDNQFVGSGSLAESHIGVLLQAFATGTMGEVTILKNKISKFQTGILIEDVATSGISIHYNNISGNVYGAKYLGSGAADATNNWWNHPSGPSHSPGLGDTVSGNLIYDPWLLEPVVPGAPPPTIFQKTLPLKIGWTLVSVDNWIDPLSAVGGNVTLAYKYTPSGGYTEVTPAALVPVDALYLKTEIGGGVGFDYSGGAPVASSKDLVAGWNLISSATEWNARDILSPLRYIDVGEQQGVGMATLVSQGYYNQYSLDYYLSTISPADWGDGINNGYGGLSLVMLNPFDGYWVYMNGPKNFGVIPGVQPIPKS